MFTPAPLDDDFKLYMVIGPLTYDDHTLTLRAAVEEFVEQGGRWVALDLARCDRVGSLTLGRLLKLMQLLRERGGDLILIAPSPFVRKILTVTNLDHIFTVVGSEEEALKRAGRSTSSHTKPAP